jgi:hypothetical protein
VETLDLKKRYSSLYKPSASRPAMVEVPAFRFLMLDGVGGVGGPEFQLSMGALFGLAYPVKFAAKKRLGLSYPVMPSEGLYWDADGGPGTPPASPDSTAWTLMIMLPGEVDSEFVNEVRAKVAAKKDIVRLHDVRVQTYSEGTSVQVLHIGPYADETPTVERLFAFAAERGYEVSGSHHEIYLSDPNRGDPAKIKTVLRYPVRKLG